MREVLFSLSKPSSNATLPSTRPYFLSLPKQLFKLGTKVSYARVYGGRSHLNHYTHHPSDDKFIMHTSAATKQSHQQLLAIFKL